MQTVNKTDDQQVNTLELVLKEMLEEQQQIAKNLQAQDNSIAQLKSSVETFSTRLEKIIIMAPPVSTRPIEEIVRKGLTDIRLTISDQPKNITRKFQLLLFPEQNARLFYKIVFGRWLIVIAILVFTNFLFQFAVHWIDNSRELKMEQLKNAPVKKASNYSYNQQTREGKRKMDSTYLKSKN